MDTDYGSRTHGFSSAWSVTHVLSTGCGPTHPRFVNGMWSKGANIKFVNRGLTVASNGNTPLDVPSAGVAGLTLLSCGVGICKPIYCKSSFHELFVQPMGRTRSTSCTALCLKGPKWLSEAVARPKAT